MKRSKSLKSDVQTAQQKDYHMIDTLTDGAIFGELALLTKLKRTATVRAQIDSKCAYLVKNDIDEM
jgi:CRP-like cAMP-binding protein